MDRSRSPESAWEHFKAVAEEEEANGAVTLSLIRDARVFSTASKEETLTWEILIEAASKQGMRAGLIAFGEELRQWSRRNGYKLAPLVSGGAATLLGIL